MFVVTVGLYNYSFWYKHDNGADENMYLNCHMDFSSVIRGLKYCTNENADF